MYGIIYKAQNKINGKCYIGQTTKTLEERKLQHLKKGSYFHNALKKYSMKNFEWSIIEKCKDDLDLAEQWYIRKFDTYKNGYNMTFGGETFSEETKRKISIALTGVNNPAKRPDVRKKISISKIGKKNPAKRKEVRQKISLSTTGKKHWNWGKHLSEETKRKISLKHNGKILSEEHKEKLRKATKNVSKIKCKYCNKLFYPWHISRYHGNKCKDKK